MLQNNSKSFPELYFDLVERYTTEVQQLNNLFLDDMRDEDAVNGAVSMIQKVPKEEQIKMYVVYFALILNMKCISSNEYVEKFLTEGRVPIQVGVPNTNIEDVQRDFVSSWRSSMPWISEDELP